MYSAFKEGRSDKDPSEGWYKGELWFFGELLLWCWWNLSLRALDTSRMSLSLPIVFVPLDNYVIPLAKKLKECGGKHISPVCTSCFFVIWFSMNR